VNQCALDHSSTSHTAKTTSAESLGRINREYQTILGEVSDSIVTLEALQQKWTEFDARSRSIADWCEHQQLGIARLHELTVGENVTEADILCKVYIHHYFESLFNRT